MIGSPQQPEIRMWSHLRYGLVNTKMLGLLLRIARGDGS